MNKFNNTKRKNRRALVPGASAVPQETKPAEVQKADRAELIAQCDESLGMITGVKSGKLALRLVSQVGIQLSGSNDFEGLCTATEMIAVHEAGLVFLRNATDNEQTGEGRDANTHRAVRMLRLFIEQLEAMAKLKGKTGQQKVVVEHVHVNAGGQAIVGAVTTARKGHGGGQQ